MHQVIYHDDPDGHASGAVIFKNLRDKGISTSKIELTPTNYGVKLPEIDFNEDIVYLADFALQPISVMKKWYGDLGDRFIWIDHHKTSLDMEEEYTPLKDIPGIRAINDDTGKPISGCELTWQFFMDTPMPEVLEMIGDWDTWRYTKESETRQQNVKKFQYYLASIETDPSELEAQFWWKKILRSSGSGSGVEKKVINSYLRKMIKEGSFPMAYQSKKWKELLLNKGFSADFKDLKAVIVNQGGNSEMFNGFYDPQKHDVMVTYQEVQGKNLTISLYTTKTDKVHVGDLAKKLGNAGDIPSGGGHAGAAGFQCGHDYFKSLYKNVKPLSD